MTSIVLAWAVGIAATCKWGFETDQAEFSLRREGGQRNFVHSRTKFQPMDAMFINATRPGTLSSASMISRNTLASAPTLLPRP